MSTASRSTNSVTTLSSACTRWSLDSTSQSQWRSRMLSVQTNSSPATADGVKLKEDITRDAFIERLKQRQLDAEARVERLKNGEEDEDDEEVASPVQQQQEEKEQLQQSEDEESEEDDEQETEYDTELEYFAHKILCLDAINHDPPTGSEVSCPYCSEGKRFESEFACSTCAFVRGVCSCCRRVIVLRTLEDPQKGVSTCLVLLTDSALLKKTFDLEEDEKEQLEAIQAQITFMLDAYFDKTT